MSDISVDADAGRYKMGTFSKLTGLSAALLRAWERRYGLLDPARMPSGHRMYTDADLAVIRLVKRQLDAGRSVGELALRGRAELLAEALGGENGDSGASLSGGSLSVEQLRDDVVRAAAELDGDLLRQTLDQAFARLSPRATVAEIIEPAAAEIGTRWARGEISVAGEHLVSAHFTFRLKHLLESANTLGRNRDPVICACLPDEHHEIGLLVIALRLASSGHRVVYLGPALPLADLDHACHELSPRAVCLSVTDPDLLAKQLPALAQLAQHWEGVFQIHVGGMGLTDPDAVREAGITPWPPGASWNALLERLTA